MSRGLSVLQAQRCGSSDIIGTWVWMSWPAGAASGGGSLRRLRESWLTHTRELCSAQTGMAGEAHFPRGPLEKTLEQQAL
jgi:hypothetical protein